MKQRTLWERVTDRIVKELARKRPAPGTRFHSVRELCRRYGISAITSRRVLDELAARGVIEKVPRKGCFLTGRSSSKRLKCVLFKALSELELSSPVFPPLFAGIACEAGRSGRRKLSFVDWDRDGVVDLLANSRNVDWLRNEGTRDGRLVFKAEGPLDSRRLAGHTTSPTTVDWDGNGVPDLLVGAEDGYFYYLRNPKAPPTQ